MVTARRRTGQLRASDGWRLSTALPLLAAAYPVIFLFTINAAEHVTLDPLWLPLGSSVGAAGACLVGLAVLLRDPQRAALLTTVAVISFFGYGHAWNGASGILDSQWPLIGAWLLGTAMALAAVWRAVRWTGPAVRGLALVVSIALLLNAATLGQAVTALGAVDPLARTDGADVRLAPPRDGSLPDVFYIVPDRYAGSSTLRTHFDFDNEPFLAALEERGFAIARGAHANYTKTPLSLGSSLNMDYLDGEALAEEAQSPDDRGPAHRLLRQPLTVPRALKRLGYQYVHIGGGWPPSSTNVDADRVFTYQGQGTFASALAQTTLLRALTDPGAAPDDPWDWRVVRATSEYALDRLEEIPAAEGPKYVFAHLLVPHAPYVFDADGSFMDRARVGELGERESYRRQLTYTNGRLLSIVDRIIAEAPDAAIVIQGDEGPFPPRYRTGEIGFDWRDASAAELEEKFGILLAMRVPNADLAEAGFHDALTPVNVFRVLFNARFDADLPLLPDRIWTHVGVHRFYQFVDITDRLRP